MNDFQAIREQNQHQYLPFLPMASLKKYYFFISLITIMVILTIMMLSYRLYKHDLSHLYNQVFVNLTLTGTHLSSDIDQIIKTKTRDSHSIAKDISSLNADKTKIEKYFQSQTDFLKQKSIDNISFINKQSHEQIFLNASGNKHYSTSQVDFFDSPSFTSGLSVYDLLSFPIKGSIKFLLFIATPVLDPDEQTTGAITMFIELDQIIKDYVTLNSKDLYFWILDSQGRILYHPHLTNDIVTNTDLQTTASMTDFIKIIVRKSSLTGEYTPPSGLKTLGAATVLNGNNQDWFIVFSTPEKSVNDLIVHFHLDHITITILMVLFVAVGIILITRMIVKWNHSLKMEILKRTAAEAQKAEVVKELHQALSEVKVLCGFLPICASCKKIRDDKGYWNQIEVYIRNHSGAEFSHGLCPDCATKLYPDLDLSNT